MSETIIGVAVLGQGRSGYGIHVNWLREAKEQYRVVAVADLMPERHEAVAELGCKGFADYRELLQDRSVRADLVVNALPSHLHTEGTLAALKAGYHVLTEKPFALKVSDFDAMVAAARESGRELFAFQNARFQPGFRKIEEILASGKLGRLLHAQISHSNFGRRWDWQASRRYGGGNLNNTGPHPLDHAIVLFGEQQPRVFSRLGRTNPFGDADNLAVVTLYGDGAPLIEVTVSSCMAFPAGDVYNLSCTHGGLSGNANTLKWKYFDPAEAPAHTPGEGWSDKRTYNYEQLPWNEESWTMTPIKENFQIMSEALYNNIHDALVRGAKPVVSLEQVRRQVAVIEQCHQQNPPVAAESPVSPAKIRARLGSSVAAS